MAFMKDILTRNIPIWEECAATPFVQEVQTGKLPLEKFKRYMIQDSIYLKNYARIYGKAIFHADTLREIQLYYSMLNFVNDTESEVRLDYLKQFCMTDNDIELIAPLPENQNYIDFMFEIASHGKNEEILMAVLPCMLSYSYIFRKLAAVPTSRQSRYWDFIKDYADEQYAESCKEWSAFAEHKCAGLSVANKKYLADIFEKASLLELAFWKISLNDNAVLVEGKLYKKNEVVKTIRTDIEGIASTSADLLPYGKFRMNNEKSRNAGTGIFRSLFFLRP